MEKQPTVKILIGYHKPAHLFQSEILVPIHCGRSCCSEPSKDGQIDSSWLLNNMIGDDTGDNISKDNRYVNEASGIYWAWKNYASLGNPDYIGFMQYGKHLIFNPCAKISKERWLPGAKVYNYDLDSYLQMKNLSPEYIIPLLKRYDCLCPEKYDVSNLSGHPKSCRERFGELSRGKIEVFDVMVEIINRKFPQFIPFLKEIETKTSHYPLNMFVMRRDLFQAYGDFIFPVLQEILNRVDLSKASVEQKRAPAYCAEFLTSMYLSYLSKNGYNVKELNVVVMKEPSIKILVGYHKPAAMLRDNVFVPIHLGRALATQDSKDGAISQGEYQWMLDHMMGDDTGDNISLLNREFCEATAMYWAWKNYEKLGNPDYIGFMHYRRHLCFDVDNTEEVQACLGGIFNAKINPEYIRKYRLTENSILGTIQDCDIVTSLKEDVSLVGAKDVRDIWRINNKLHLEDIDHIIEKLGNLYPEYKDVAQKYLSSSHAYLKNIFILRKQQFIEFCEMLFGVLFACQDLCKKYKNHQEHRVLSYASEWLFGIYITKKEMQGNKCLELKRTFVENTDTDTYHILISFDNNYYRHAYVLLNSVFANNRDSNFQIHVLYSKLKPKYIDKMTFWVKKLGHRIYFYHVDEKNYDFCPIKKGDKVTIQTYFRLFAANYLPTYVKKLLYLDIDTCCVDSLKSLFETSMADIPVMAVYGRASEKRRESLGMKPSDKYFQCGVLLLNLEYWRKNGCIEGLSKFIRDHHDCLVRWDQDVINGYFRGKIGYLAPKYNLTQPFFDKNAISNPDPFFMQWLIAQKVQACKHPVIIHFTGFDRMKPWWKNSTADPSKRKIWLSYRSGVPYGENKLKKYRQFSVMEYFRNIREKFVKTKSIQASLEEELHALRKICHGNLFKIQTKIEASSIHPKTFGEFRGVNEGKDFVLCASGPSILHFNSSMISNGKFCGVNSAVRKSDIDFDYLFCQDHHFEKGKNQFINEFDNGKCIKFYGKIENQRILAMDGNINLRKKYGGNVHTHRLPFEDVLTNHARPYILSEYMGQMPYNLEYEPMADVGGTVFSAMQFALFTNPKRIFLVGCDHTSGYFYDPDFKMFDASIQASNWVRFIMPYIKENYPNIQIISVNPVGLRGLFRDVYTRNFIRKHPRTKGYTLLEDIVEES